jgi:hypothetical protein
MGPVVTDPVKDGVGEALVALADVVVPAGFVEEGDEVLYGMLTW